MQQAEVNRRALCFAFLVPFFFFFFFGSDFFFSFCFGSAAAGKPRDFALGGGDDGGGGDGTSEEEHASRDSGRRLRRRERATKAGDNGGRRGRSDKPSPGREAVGGRDSGSGGGSWQSRINKLTCLRDFVSLELLAVRACVRVYSPQPLSSCRIATF